jgi:hypothetical protein
MRQLLDDRTAETRTLIAETRQVVDANAEETRIRFAETQRLVVETAKELRHYFDVSVEQMRDEIKLVAEGVLNVDQKLDREAADIRSEMRQGFADTQAMIKFSHAGLDRRISALEG